MNFKIGADPELFVREPRKANNGKLHRFISAETCDGPLIPGTKKNPFEVRGGAIQVDGVAAEFNINAAKDFKEFFGNISTVVQDLRNRIKTKKDGAYLKAVPTATFGAKYFNALPAHTRELGCEPDYSVYTGGAPNPRPQTDKPFRTGSGHIHIGWTSGKTPFEEGHMKDCMLVVRELDKYLLTAAKDWDTDTKRMSLYGKPGSFRPKSYGVEYRPLSNAWLSSPESIQYVYYITLGVMRSIASGKHDVTQDKVTIFNKDKSNSENMLFSLSQHIPEVFK